MSGNRPAGLGDEHSLLADLVDDLVEARIAPQAEAIAESGEIVGELAGELDAHGLLAIDVPVDRGGSGADLRAAAIAITGLARGSAAVAALAAASHGVAAGCLAGDGPAAERWQAGGAGTAFADAAEEDVEALERGDGWLLRGRVSRVEAPLVPAQLLVAFDAGDEPRTALLAANRGGVEICSPDSRTGLDGAGARAVVLTDVQVGPEDRVGGDSSAAAARQYRLLTTACRANGVSRAAIDAAVGYMEERRQFGVRLVDMAGLRSIAASAAARLRAAEASVWDLAGRPEALQTRGRGACAEVAVACTETAVAVTTDALQLHGGYGYTHDFPVERLFRDALSLRASIGGSRLALAAAADDLLGPVRA